MSKPVNVLFGIGPRRVELFARLGVETVMDLLFLQPRSYEDRTRMTPLCQATPEQVQTFMGEVVDLKAKFVPRRMLNIFQALLHDETGELMLTWFNQRFREEQILIGTRLTATGKVSYDPSGLPALVMPEIELLEEEFEPLSAGRIIPIYPLTEDLTQGVVRSSVRSALKLMPKGAEFDPLPRAPRERNQLLSLDEAFRQLHFPDSMALAEEALRTLVFHELFELQTWLAHRRFHVRARRRNPRVFEKMEKTRAFIRNLGFDLTPGQTQAVEIIREDLGRPEPMNRLLQGDVGCGKTLVAVIALALMAENGFQGAFMAPTEILAEQHFISIKDRLSDVGLSTDLLTSSVPGPRRREMLKKLASGKLDIIIGTHSLLSDEVKFHNLGLVVVDEQHRFGVLQRAALPQKGGAADLMVMTATPIPRTLALTIYGDLDATTIEDMPPGRKPVKTFAVRDKSAVDNMVAGIKKELAGGRKAFFVCPLIDESEKIQARSVSQFAQRVKVRFPKAEIGIIHGRMGIEERERVMAGFRTGGIQILVATPVIEVGVDVPEATVMVIENAERFGMAQLHQLRGRVGRGDNPGFCYLFDRGETREAEERIKALVGSTDGFYIAQKDLDIRGAGRITGSEQSGRIAHFRIVNLGRKLDRELLPQVRAEAFSLVAENPALEGKDLELLRERLEILDSRLAMIEAG